MSSKIAEFRLQNTSYLIVLKEEYTKQNEKSLLTLLAIPSMEKISFGYLLRNHRVQSNQTQKELAIKVGTSQKHIDKIENGKIIAPQKNLEMSLKNELGSDFAIAVDAFKSNWSKEKNKIR